MIRSEQPRGREEATLLRSEDSSAPLTALRARLDRAVRAICPPDLLANRDDLVQEAMLRVMHGHEGNREFNTSYLRKAAYCALVDEIRKRRRWREESVEEETAATPFRSASPNPERIAAGRETGEAIRRCLLALIASRRRAVTLYLQGHRVPEVARLLDWGVKKAENLVFRGMADLRKCLSSRGVRP